MSLKSFKDNPNEIKMKQIIEGIEVLKDLTESLSDNRFDETNSILVKSIKQTSYAISIQMKQLYDGLKNT